MKRRWAAGWAAGFTLLELMVVLGIVSLMAALAYPRLSQYSAQEEAKSAAQSVAAALRTARVRAMKEGIQYLVIFNPSETQQWVAPPLPNAATGMITLARIVRDLDGNGVESVADNDPLRGLAINIDVRASSVGVRTYDPAQDPYNAVVGPTIDPRGGALGALVLGSSFSRVSLTNRATIAVFNSRGLPVAFAGPNTFGGVGSGSGGYYVTEGREVFAAMLGPLGEVRAMRIGVGGVWR